MDELPTINAAAVADNQQRSSAEPVPSLAPPSTSVLSDAPMTDAVEPPEPPDLAQSTGPNDQDANAFQAPPLSAQTESILKRINANAANAAASGTPGWEAAKEQIMRDMATSDKFPTPTPPRETSTPKRGGRGGKRASFTGNEGSATSTNVKMEGDAPQTTPSSTGRGGRGGRPRGRGRGGGRGGKRKREDGSEEDSDDSEVYTPAATMTKSGRSVQKPTSFVPPPTSPTTTPNKRKRPYRRNPESAVCKVCLRGTSPASNMIVFCDGCNTPYHRYCHHPPIDQAVVDEVDKEWYCKQCEKERVVPVPESEVAEFVSAEGASLDQRQKYFSSLAPGMLVTLLTKATTMKPDLPVFHPDFQARAASNVASVPESAPAKPLSNGHTHPSVRTSTTSELQTSTSTTAPPPPRPPTNLRPSANKDHEEEAEEEGYEDHPPNYPRPGHGLIRTLPPEQDDLQWLVDDDDRFGVFTHMYQADSQAANASLHGGLEQ